MKKLKIIDKIANKLTDAFVKNKTISAIPTKFTKNIKEAEKLRVICESKINWPIIGFKAGGTGIPLLKKLGEKEPFYASVYKKNFLSNGNKVKINKSTFGIELEVCFLIKKSFFNLKKNISSSKMTQYISHMAPCIEIVGYRQRKKGIKYLGDLCSDFGGNVKFIIGSKKKFKKFEFNNLKTIIENKKSNQSVKGNTNTVYINPLNSLKFVLNKLIKNKVKLNSSFYVFTGSTVGIVPILSESFYRGSIEKLGTVKVTIK